MPGALGGGAVAGMWWNNQIISVMIHGCMCGCDHCRYCHWSCGCSCCNTGLVIGVICHLALWTCLAVALYCDSTHMLLYIPHISKAIARKRNRGGGARVIEDWHPETFTLMSCANTRYIHSSGNCKSSVNFAHGEAITDSGAPGFSSCSLGTGWKYWSTIRDNKQT